MEKTRYRYYSQNGEDFLLWNLFHYKKKGFYVDVGAFDGVHLSNSYSFEQQGWSGICIEAHTAYFKLCNEARSGAICLNVACVSDDNLKTVRFYTEELGLLSGVKDNREVDVRSRYEKRGLEFKGFNKITVPASTLNTVLEKYLPADAEIDFISIDVEGTELEVLKGLDLSRFRPRAIVIEANTNDQIEAINHLVNRNGYKEARRLGVNIFFARDKNDIKNLQAVPLDCTLEKNLHPLGEKYTLTSHLNEKIIREKRAGQNKQTAKGKLIEKLLSRFRS